MRLDQASLFDPPYARGSATSREAAEKIRGHAGTLRNRYLELLAMHPMRGICDHEAAGELHCALTSIQPRRANINKAAAALLEGRDDLVIQSGYRTATHGQFSASNWKINQSHPLAGALLNLISKSEEAA